MKQINLIGTILGTSGYDSHTRNLANALNKLIPVRLTTNLLPGWERVVNDQELDMIKRVPDKEEINLIVTHPAHWRLNTQAKRNWAYCIWEGDKVPEYFIEEMLNPDIEYVLVASSHTVQAIRNAPNCNDEAIRKIRIIPHGVNREIFQSREKPKDFTFLVNKGWRNMEDRGGTQYAIKAYIEEFTQKDNVNLLLKVNPAYGIPDVTGMIKALCNRSDDLPKITIDTMAYEYQVMAELYNKANIFVAPTRAEAYGIPLIEAMSCGLPVITTNFGGQTDFCNNENGWVIGGDLEEIKHELSYEGIKWLTPSITELRAAMREAYENKDSLVFKKTKAFETADKNTWDISAKKLMELL